MSLDIVKYFDTPDTVNTILKGNNKVKLRISECTLEALEKKSAFIEKCLNDIYVPICIVYHPYIRVYDKLYILKEEGPHQ